MLWPSSAFLLTSWIIARLMYKVRKQADEALSSVSYRVIEAEEQERHRIAGDLHEDIGQRLTLLAIEMEQIQTDTANPAVDLPSRMDAVRKQTLENIDRCQRLGTRVVLPKTAISWHLSGHEQLLKRLRQRRRVEIDFRSDRLPSVVPPDVALCLIRVLQEAPHNGVKHSGVRQFDVQLNGTSNEIHLTVSDCGLGFDPATAKTGRVLGLNRMQERLKRSLSIDSQPKRGTTIHARIPLQVAILHWRPDRHSGVAAKSFHRESLYFAGAVQKYFWFGTLWKLPRP